MSERSEFGNEGLRSSNRAFEIGQSGLHSLGSRSNRAVRYAQLRNLAQGYSKKLDKSAACIRFVVLHVFPCCRDPVLPLLLGFLRGARRPLAWR
jgi:hypothetical protein